MGCALICSLYRDSLGFLPHILSLHLSKGKGRGTAFAVEGITYLFTLRSRISLLTSLLCKLSTYLF